MRRKILMYALYGVLAVSLCGCGKEKVEYGQEETIQSDSNADVKSGEGLVYTDGIAKTIGAEQQIQEQVETADGERLNIYGNVIVPDVKTLNVYRAEKCEVDKDLIKQIVDAFSDDGVIYSGNEENLPKSEIIYMVLYYEKEREKLETAYKQEYLDDEAYRQYASEIEQKQAYYQELYEQADESYQQVDYDTWKNGDTLILYHEGKVFYMSTFEQGFDCYAAEYTDTLPDLPEDTEMVYRYEKSSNRRIIDDDDTRERLEKAAQNFSERLGTGRFTVNDFEYIYYGEFPIYHTEGEPEYKDYGYYVKLCRMMDGVKVDASSYNNIPGYTNEEDMLNTDLMIDYKGLESMDIMLDEDFQVIGFRYNNPLCLPEVETAQVTLLPYETIKETFLNSLAKEPVMDGREGRVSEDGHHTFRIEKNYSDLELLYFRMENPEKEGEYVLIPAWRLSVSDGAKEDNACMINAIDGSRINLANEIYELVDVGDSIEEVTEE